MITPLRGGAVVLLTALAVAAEPAEAATAVGDQACARCHAEQFASYEAGAHARTSAAATPSTIKGRFIVGENVLRTANPNLLFVMENTGVRCTQTAMIRTAPSEQIHRTESFDVVVGSGRKGQTYLSWDGDRLCQLPVSWWAESNEWVNSPGYPDGAANFDRPVPGRCLECHATSFETLAPPNRYQKNSLVLGITCEKCHGPASEHVRQSTLSPRHAAGDILNPAKLSRDRQIDGCALCHAGAGEPVTAPLSYQPGDVLAHHLTFPPAEAKTRFDVHASQVEMLQQSRCYRESAMTCSTCHDVHRPQRDATALATRCLTCHTPQQCAVAARANPTVAAQCVTCHMPVETTEQIVISRILGRALQPKVRNHRIAIYPAGG